MKGNPTGFHRPARPAGIEPATLGLKAVQISPLSDGKNQPWDQSGTKLFPPKSSDAAELARAVVTLAAAGQAVPAVLVSELARAVLRSELATLADRALQPGPCQLRAGIDLAGDCLQPLPGRLSRSQSLHQGLAAQRRSVRPALP